jgi:hypothetical protein
MKKLLVKFIFAIFLLAGTAFGQGGFYSNVVLSTNATTGALQGVSGAFIYVCREPATGTTVQCSSLAPIFSDQGLTATLANPFQTDISGNFQFYAAPGLYRIQIFYNGVFTTLTNVPLGNPFAPIGTFKTVTFSATPTFDASQGGIYSMTLTSNVTSSTVTNPTTGQLIAFLLCEDVTGSRTFVWPTNFADTPSLNTTSNACNNFAFYYTGTNWRLFTSGSGTTAGAGPFAGGALVVNANAGMTSWASGFIAIEGINSTPVAGRIVIGDGTGWRLTFAKRVSGTDTDLLYVQDDGSLASTATANGAFEPISSNAGAAGPANKVRYTGCTNIACVSENATGPFAVVKSSTATGGLTNTKIPMATAGGSYLADSNIGNFDIAVNNAPRSLWSSWTTGTTSGAYTENQHTFTKPFTLTRFTSFVTTAGVTCTTGGVLSIFDLTATSDLATLTLTNGTNYFDSGVLAVAVVAGHNIQFRVKTAGTGCATFPGGINWNMEYASQ